MNSLVEEALVPVRAADDPDATLVLPWPWTFSRVRCRLSTPSWLMEPCWPE